MYLVQDLLAYRKIMWPQRFTELFILRPDGASIFPGLIKSITACA